MNITVYPSKAAEKKLQQIVDRGMDFKKKDVTAVSRILEDVRRGGDQALIGYVNRFDSPRLPVSRMKVTAAEMKKAKKSVDRSFIRSLKRAAAQIESFHHRQLPRLTGGPFRYKHFAAEYVEKAMKMATKPLKQAVIAPSMLALLYPLDGEVPGYSREKFLSDLCDQCEQDIRKAFAAGAVRVSIDFTEGRLACRNDPNNPWTGRGMLGHFIELNNRVLDRRGIFPQLHILLRAPSVDHLQSAPKTDVVYGDELLEHRLHPVRQ